MIYQRYYLLLLIIVVDKHRETQGDCIIPLDVIALFFLFQDVQTLENCYMDFIGGI